MKRRNATRSALFTSIISLLLCVSMLVGTTFAWFTDTVTSGKNVIASGNLDVELYHTNNYVTTAEKVDGLTDLFTVEEGKAFLWEPGAVLWENFEVANKGSLALKYQLALNFDKENATKNAEGKTLAEVLKVAVIPGGFNGDREAAKALDYNYDLESFALTGSLLAGTTASEVYGIVIYWQPQPGIEDNKYNVAGGMSIDLGVELFATQLTAETDSFDDTYDADAWEDTKSQRTEVSSSAAYINNDGSASLEVNAAPAVATNLTTIDAPAGAFEPTDKVEVEVETTNSLFNVTADGGVVASLDVTMTVNGTETSADLEDGKYFTVTTYISKGLTNVGVAYTGTDGKAQPSNVTYDVTTGKLTFQTNHFSNYAVSGNALAYDEANDTALTTIQQVVNATQKESNTVVIPEANQEVIEKEIEKLPEDQQQAAAAATAAAKIGDETYATLAEAFANAKDEDTIVVLNNVAVNAAITNSKVITLDLNGKTISGTDNYETGSFGLITNNGTLTVTGSGRIELTAIYDRDWNAFSSVISNQPGGKLVVENGTIEHLGGSDMAYGIDNLTNGKGTYAEVVINGGTVKSPYRAIRQFLNGIEADNILTVNGGTIEGANKSIWMQDPSANNNTGKLTVSDKAVLNGDVYLFVCAGSTEWPVEVSIAASAVNGEVMTGNVPEGYVVHNVNGVWTVLKNTVVVSTADELVAALEAKRNVIFANDIKIDPANMSNAYGKTGINVKYGQTIDGNGYTLNIKGAGGTWDSGINTTGGVIKNITVTGSFRGIFINHTSDYSEKVVLENVTIGGNGTVYTISCDQGLYQGIEATNCTFNGWTSFAKTAGEAKFVNCNFGAGSGYKYCRPYSSTEFVNCTFCEGYTVDTSCATVTFTDCANPNG